jgi:hypothetical protein
MSHPVVHWISLALNGSAQSFRHLAVSNFFTRPHFHRMRLLQVDVTSTLSTPRILGMQEILIEILGVPLLHFPAAPAAASGLGNERPHRHLGFADHPIGIVVRKDAVDHFLVIEQHDFFGRRHAADGATLVEQCLHFCNAFFQSLPISVVDEVKTPAWRHLRTNLFDNRGEIRTVGGIHLHLFRAGLRATRMKQNADGKGRGNERQWFHEVPLMVRRRA